MSPICRRLVRKRTAKICPNHLKPFESILSKSKSGFLVGDQVRNPAQNTRRVTDVIYYMLNSDCHACFKSPHRSHLQTTTCSTFCWIIKCFALPLWTPSQLSRAMWIRLLPGPKSKPSWSVKTSRNFPSMAMASSNSVEYAQTMALAVKQPCD